MVTGPGSFGQMIATHPDVDKVGFTGSTEVQGISTQGSSFSSFSEKKTVVLGAVDLPLR